MNFDDSLTHWINTFSNKFALFDWLMITITRFGPYLLIVMIALRWFSKKNRTEERHLAIQAALATVTSLFFNQLILLFVQRVRPYEVGLTELLIERSHDPSFPSGIMGAILIVRIYKYFDSITTRLVRVF